MPLPDGARYTDASRRRVRLSDGSTVARQRAMNLGAQEIGFASDYKYRNARAAVNVAKKSPRYKQDVAQIRSQNPGIKQREIDRVLLELYKEKEAGRTNKRRNTGMGSGVQQWNALTGRSSYRDWQESA